MRNLISPLLASLCLILGWADVSRGKSESGNGSFPEAPMRVSRITVAGHWPGLLVSLGAEAKVCWAGESESPFWVETTRGPTGLEFLTIDEGPAGELPKVLIIGDTQHLSEVDHPVWGDLSESYVILGRWLREHVDPLNIRAVLLVGDLIDNRVDPQGEKMRAFVDEFRDIGLPWGFSLGNHDYDGQSNTGRWVDYIAQPEVLPMGLLSTQPWFDEAMPEPHATDDEAYNFAFLFNLGGPIDDLAICLTYFPSAAMFEWAIEKAAQHPDKRVWIVTHAFLDQRGQVREWPVPPHYPDDGLDLIMVDQMWDDYLSRIPNLAVVAGGHFNFGTHWAKRRVLAGDHGNLMHALFVNAQEDENGGEGFLHMLSVHGEDAAVESYHPVTNRWEDRQDENYFFNLRFRESVPHPLLHGLQNYFRWNVDLGTVEDVHGSLGAGENPNLATAREGVAGEKGVIIDPARRQFIKFPDPAGLHGGADDWSMDFWINVNDPAGDYIATVGYPTQELEWSLRHIDNLGGRVVVRISENGQNSEGSATSEIQIVPGQWHHVAMQYTNWNRILGVSIDRESWAITGARNGMFSGNGDFVIGSTVHGFIQFDGSIVPGARWARLLTPGEWDTRYNGGVGLSYE